MKLSNLIACAALAAAALASSAFAAAPAPAQVEEAIRAQNWPAAESMLKEVVAEKPGSAKAWYFLAQTEEKLGKKGEALADLRRSESIDPSLKFASPGEPAAMERRLSQSLAARSTIQPARANTTAASSQPDDGSAGIWAAAIILFVIVAFIAIVYGIYRLFSRAATAIGGNSYGPAAGYGQAYPQGSTVVVNNGHNSSDLLTTMIVADAISDHHRHNHYDRDYDRSSNSYSSGSAAPSEPARSDSAFDLGGGSSSSWDSGSSSSSSSFDSGSSSSSSDSSSSW
jgi:tetratricopeptide (TPR) repeat protein